jgi:phosphate/sulfate permease
MDVIVLVAIITTLVFDFTNGFHDTANAMATSIATGALKPKVAAAISAGPRHGEPRVQGFKAGQVVLASMVSLAHGTNDA